MLKLLRQSATSLAIDVGLFERNAVAINFASWGMSSERIPQRANSGVPMRNPFKSPDISAIGRPMPQAKNPPLRNVFEAA